MILDEFVVINITPRNITYFKNKNYKIDKLGDLLVKVSDLSNSSRVLVNVKCEICGEIKKLNYSKYIENLKRQNYYSCRKCSQIKRENTMITNFGVDNIMKLDSYIQKGLETKKDKFPNGNYDVEKYNKTCLEKFGCNYALQNEEVKNKSKATKKLKYGNEYYTNSEKIRETLKNGNFEKVKEEYKDLNILHMDENYEYHIMCEKGHEYSITHKNLYQRKIIQGVSNPCTICHKLSMPYSFKEKELYEFIKSNYDGEIICNSNKVIGSELDIFLPELNLAFEFNGVYWHSEFFKEINHHRDKLEVCLNKNIQLIYIWEDYWDFKKDIVKSMILNKLKKNTNKIYARKCEIKEITNVNIVRDFLNKNHIQGFIGSKFKLGLYFKNELVSLMTFGKERIFMKKKSINPNDFEMLRFCNKLNTTVIGGASKLFKYFLKTYNPNQILSFADRDHSNGNLYTQLGFEFIKKTKPNYYYIYKKERHHRYIFRKSVLVKDGFDPNKSEHEIMLEIGAYKIYNAGNLEFIYKNF